jgi:hypothetical protein
MPKPSVNIVPRPRPPLAAAADILVSPDAYATTLLVLCLDAFGHIPDPEDPKRAAFWSWHPATVRQELKERFGVEVPWHNLDRIMAAVAVVTTDAFFKDEDRFVKLANILAGDGFDPSAFEPADAAECAWAVTEALLLSPPDDDPEPFSDGVRRYIGFVLREEGYVVPPDVLRIALDADWSDQVNYDWSDDPVMFGAVYDTQTAKKDEVEAVVREGLREMLEQIASLPLENGSAREIEERLAALATGR